MTNEVLVEHEDGMVIITINRPQVRNAVNRAVSYGVCEAIDEMERRPDLRLAILTGAGGNFCAGMDLKAFSQGEITRVEGRGILGPAQRRGQDPAPLAGHQGP
ncbi:enoyl-CoA hydratase-related protein, partial [Roseateles sp. GG27B]